MKKKDSINKETDVKRETKGIFEGMSFNYPPVSKEDYFNSYEEYIRRCSKEQEVSWMHEQIEKTISDLNDYIQEILEKGSDKEREALPELVNSLTNLYREYKFL